ncbi:MAG: hypothetical protein JWN44_5581 [Myxococcales bacterium]|nr:hypothetical protein [Myxococcales bacterium]
MKTFAFLAGMLLVAGCTNHTGTGREPDEYTGCGTDENWRAFSDQESTATVADATAPKVTSPAAGATVPSATKPKIVWQQNATDVGMPDGDVVHSGPSCTDCCPQFNTGSLSTLHLPPISGNAYDLRITVDGAEVWRVITTLQEWGPSDALWASWKGKTVSFKIYRMELLRNDVKQGPYVATSDFTFSVGS